MKYLVAIACGVLFMASMPSRAAIISINPDYYADGANISNATAGVTLSAFNWAGGFFDPAVSTPDLAPIFASACGACGPFSGQHVFSGGLSENYFGGFRDYNVLAGVVGGNPPTQVGAFNLFRADFAAPTNFVQVIAGAGGEEFTFVTAFDTDDNAVGSCSLGSGSLCDLYLTPEYTDVRTGAYQLSISTGTNNIAYLLAGGGIASTRIQSLTFVRSVPEPATLGLFAVSLVGFGIARRRSVLPLGRGLEQGP
jgi:hypothetical protein